MIEISTIKSFKGFEQVIELERITWNCSLKETTPTHINQVNWAIGGTLLGAYHKTKLVGFVHTFPAFTKDLKPYHHLHSIGVHPDYQGENIGFLLIKAQQKRSLEMGIHHLTWTFDPLETANANLYLSKIGAKITHYKTNYYGILEGINGTIPTDRFFVALDLNKNHIIPPTDLKNYLIIDGTQVVNFNKIDFNQKLAIQIPSNFQNIKEQNTLQAQEIRLNTRRVFEFILNNNYSIHGFYSENKNGMRRCFYLINSSCI